MSSAAQIVANRANAEHSTGPRTPEGKQRSAANSTRHGLASGSAVLPQEDAAALEQLQAQYLDEFQPATPHETFLVEQMTHSRWRIARLHRLEQTLLCTVADAQDDSSSPDMAILSHMQEKGVNVPNALQRYLAAAERSYYKAYRELTEGRTRVIETQAAEARTEETLVRAAIANQKREAEAAFMDYIYNGPRKSRSSAPPAGGTLKSDMPPAEPGGTHNETSPLHATRQSLRAPAL
jgi:hypothetical protein